MGRGTPSVGPIVGLLLVLLPLGTLRAEEGDPEAFERAVERIHESCKKEQFESALRKLESLLKKHEGQGYARARRAELEDLAERIAFGIEVEPPEVGSVVSGRVEKWDPETGYLNVRYDAARAEDLARVQGGWTVFPGAITGPFLLEVSGDSYPDDPRSAPEMLLAGGEVGRAKRAQATQIVFGTPRREVGDRIEWMPARILHRDGDRDKEVAKLDKIPISAGKRYRLQLKVTKSVLTVGINGKTLFNYRRRGAIEGHVGFQAPGWKQCRFAGTIEPAWIQDRIDQLAQAKLAEFRKRYRRTRYLPAWLFEDAPPEAAGPTPDPAEPAPTEPASPVAVEPRHRSALRRANALIDKREWDRARSLIADLERGGVPRVVTTHLAARVSVGDGELTRGLEELDTCLREEPSFLDALLLKAEVLRRLGRTDEAYRTYRYAIKKHRTEPRAYESAAVAMLLAARPETAQTVTELAVQSGVTSRDLELVARMVVKAERGPVWNRTFEYRSRNYHVLSDISKETCIEAAKILEEALVSYRVNLAWVSRDKTRLYPVYVFGGRHGFQEYMSEFGALLGTVPDQVAGLYNPLLKQLLIWHLPDRDEMLQTVRHEGFHQYLDRFLPDAPIWFNEGLAVYHQNAVEKPGKLEFGAPHPYYLEVLEKEGLVPLDEFLGWSRREFYAASPRSYAQAWALMHLLKEGEPKHRRLLDRLIEEFQTKPPAEVLRERIPPSALPALGTALSAHVGELGSR